MKKFMLTSFYLLIAISACKTTFAANTSDQVQLLNSQIQSQLQKIQATQQEQLKTLNTQIQTQLKQVQTDTQKKLQELNTKIQDMQVALQKQIQQINAANAGTKVSVPASAVPVEKTNDKQPATKQ